MYIFLFYLPKNNPYMLPVMDDLVVDAARKQNGRGEAMTHLIDCYCGSGLFCLGSAKHFDVCVGIEVNDLAVQEAEGNAEGRVLLFGPQFSPFPLSSPELLPVVPPKQTS